MQIAFCRILNVQVLQLDSVLHDTEFNAILHIMELFIEQRIVYHRSQNYVWKQGNDEEIKIDVSKFMVCKFLCHFYKRNRCVTMFDLPVLKILTPHQIKMNLKDIVSHNRFILDLNSKGGSFLKEKSKHFQNVHVRSIFLNGLKKKK